MSHSRPPPNSRKNACLDCPRAAICLLPQNEKKQALTEFEFSAILLKQGEHLCYQGEQSKNLYIIQAGILKSTLIKSTGEEFVMGFYLPTDLFGWEGIDDTQRSVTISAVDYCNICVIPTDKIVSLTQKHAALGEQLLKIVSLRIHQDNIALLRTTAQQRVATFLLQFELRYRQLGFPKGHLQLIMTHQDLANYLRITPSTISRIFHDMIEKKLIAMDKHAVNLLDKAAIYGIAEANHSSDLD